MPTRDLANDVNIVRIAGPGRTQGPNAITVDADQTVDLVGYQSATLVGMVGDVRDADGDRDVTFDVLYSDEASSGFEAIDSRYLIGQDSASVTFEGNGTNPNGTRNRAVKWGYKGPKRYLRMRMRVNGGGDNQDRMDYAMLCIGGHPAHAPVGFELDDENEDHRS